MQPAPQLQGRIRSERDEERHQTEAAEKESIATGADTKCDRGQSQRHSFGIFVMRKTTVSECLAQQGDDTLPVAIGRTEIAGRGGVWLATADEVADWYRESSS